MLLFLPMAVANAEQSETAAPLKPGAPNPHGLLGRKFLTEYSKCMLQMQRAKVEQLLSYYPFSDDYMKYLEKMIFPACLPTGSSIRFTSAVYPGILYLIKYQQKFAHIRPEYTVNDMDFAAEVPEKFAGTADRYVPIRQFGQCVVRGDPENVHLLLISAPGSDKEGEAFQALQPVLGRCIGNAEDVRLTKLAIVSAVAEVAYRLAENEGDRPSKNGGISDNKSQ